MEIRRYELRDRDGCLEVFDSNTPDWFCVEERSAFERFLDAPDAVYSVMDLDGVIVGCGGYYFRQDGMARLTWGMIRREWHRQGLGRFLLLHRIRKITKTGQAALIGIETSAAAAGFFERQGFHRTAVNGAAVSMVKKLAVCAPG